MNFQILDPNDHPDWDDLLIRSNDSRFFHTSAWARTLETTYGFKSLYFSVLEAGQLMLLMPFMEVQSLLTGKRGISLPFTDACPPLVSDIECLKEAADRVITYGEKNRWEYVEWRDGSHVAHGTQPWESYYFHEIDLTKTESDLFSSLSDNNRRNIRKAVKENIVIRIDRSQDSLRDFQRLNLLTRKRHGLPPQPTLFFRNVYKYVISRNYGIIVTASHKNRIIAASVFFHFGTKALYKYGASEMEHQNLRPNNLIMWEALKWYKNEGLETIDLGRTEMDNPGLLQYKRTWGAKETLLEYYRYRVREKTFVRGRGKRQDVLTRLFTHTPTAILRLIGRLFYKHAG
jgi:hypothetical protein